MEPSHNNVSVYCLWQLPLGRVQMRYSGLERRCLCYLALYREEGGKMLWVDPWFVLVLRCGVSTSP